MVILIVLTAVLAFIGVGTILYLVSIYNGLVTVKNNIDKSWGNIDVLLKQRYEEIPNLVSCVEGYMAHERQVLEELTRARTQFMQANTVGDKANADNVISGALKSVFAVAENYPQLKANENFLQLQSRISGLENEIADRREFYNDSVNTFNIRIEQVPDVVMARALNMTRREMFKVEAEAREPVKVRFARG